MGAATIVNVAETLKNIWENDIYDYMYEDQAYLGLCDKDQSWEGLQYIVTVMYGGMAGRSADFGKAQANKSPPKYKKMQIETKDNFALWSVDHKLITLTRSQRGSLVRALAENTEKAMSKFKRSTCWMLWGNGGGSVGRISALSTTTLANDTATLYDINDIRNFDIDDVIEFANDDGYYATAGVLGGTAKVISLDEDLGKVVFDIALGGIAGLGTGDYLFHEGDYANVISGVPAYVTLNKPGVSSEPTSIWSMLRTDHPTRLAGSRYSTSRLLLIEGIKKALATSFRRNIKTSHIYAPPEIYNDIEMSMQGQKRFIDEKVGSVGYRALEFTLQGGKSVKVYSDADIRKSPDATTSYVFGLNQDTWKLHTAEEYPMWLNTVANGGQRMTVEQNANSSEGRLGGYGNHYTNAAGQNWVLAVT
jgi:hypothetical protein